MKEKLEILLKKEFELSDDVLIVGKGPGSSDYLKHIYKTTISFGINELALMPGIDYGFIIDYEPISYVEEKIRNRNLKIKLILAEYPNIKVNARISRPIEQSITVLEIFSSIEKNSSSVYTFENRFKLKKIDYSQNLVSVVSLLKILKSSGIKNIRTIGIGASGGYYSNSNKKFGTQLQLGYGQQIPLIYKLSSYLKLKIWRLEAENLNIFIKNAESDEELKLYKSFIQNVLMLRNANVVNENKIENKTYMEIDCNKYKPQSKYFSKNFLNVQKKIKNKNEITYQEVMSFFVDIRIILIYEKKFVLSSKKSPYISYFQALYRSAIENNLDNKNIYKIIKNEYNNIEHRKKNENEKKIISIYNEKIKIILIYCIIIVNEIVEIIKLKVSTSKIYYKFNNWIKNDK